MLGSETYLVLNRQKTHCSTWERVRSGAKPNSRLGVRSNNPSHVTGRSLFWENRRPPLGECGISAKHRANQTSGVDERRKRATWWCDELARLSTGSVSPLRHRLVFSASTVRLRFVVVKSRLRKCPRCWIARPRGDSTRSTDCVVLTSDYAIPACKEPARLLNAVELP